MTPQLTKIAECLSESHAREIKLARCLAESLKRIQSLETSGGKQAKVIEKQFNQALRGVAEALAKEGSETAGALTQRIDGIAQALPVELSAIRSEVETVREMAAKTTGAANIAAAEIAQRMTEIEANFPAQLAALKTEFATPAAQAAAPQSFNPRGAYEPGEKYKPFDYVSSNGSSYIALVENPTQPPSKKSKQWMLVAARGAGGGVDSGGGGVSGLGTAAYRDVGQAEGNVLEFGVDATISIGGAGTGPGLIRLHDGANDNFMLLQAIDAGLSITAGDGSRVRIKPPTDGDRLLTIQDIDGTIALLSQVGDRYLTSSTTSNTVSNGAKTFTVGTGLAYSPTQDITIVFNASNHMHAAVTSYNSTTGVLVVDVNSHTGSGTYAVWTVNVGGIGAGAIPSGGTTGQVLAKVSSTSYDDAWVTPTVAVGGITGLGTGVATALAINVGTAGAALVNGGALGTPSSGTVTNLTGTASININGTVGATTASTGAFTTLNASGLTRVGTATTADALSDVLIATSATTQRGLTIQGKASQSAPLLRIVESTNNAANNGWQFDANAVYWAGSGTAGGYINQGVMITQPGFYYKWNSSTTNLFSAATFSLGPTVAGSKILAIGNGTQFDTSGGISCAQIILDKTVTATGTTGAVTINKTSGSVNFAAAASSLVVTNSFCTVNSVILLTVGTNDTTMRSAIAVAAAGSFTIYPTTAPTAETRVNFLVTN
jgi:hypothetical protein